MIIIEFLQNFAQNLLSFEDPYLSFMLTAGMIIFLLTISYYLYLHLTYKNIREKLAEISKDEKDTHKRIFSINAHFDESKKSTMLKRIWQRYYNEYNNGTNQTIPDPLYYFNNDELVNKVGFRKLIEIIPSVFVSLGLLGTFMGIIIGISDIDTSVGSEGLFTGINSLLSGMSFAFNSSILGILISLFYQLCDKTIFYRSLNSAADKLLVEFDKAIPIETESSLLEKMVEVQKSQMDDMKTFFTDRLIPELSSGISDSISNAITPQLEKSNEIMDQVAKNTLEAQSDSMNEMVEHFVESLNELTGNQMEKLGDALHKTVEWQEKVHNEMSGLVSELSNVAQEQAEMAKKTTELSEQMNNYTEKLVNYQDRLSDTTNELEAITQENTKLLSTMVETYEQLTTKQQEEIELFDQRVTTMNNTVENITNLDSTFTELNEEMKLTLETIVNTTGDLNENAKENKNLTQTLMEQHELSNQWSTKTHELLEDVAQNINLSGEVQEILENLHQAVSSERTTLNQLQSEYSQTLASNVQKLAELWDENNTSMSDSQTQLTNLNDSLSRSMESFAEHMSRGVQGTFEQFDVQLKNAVGYLDRGVSGIGLVTEALETEIGKVDKQLTKFNEQLREFNSTTENRVIINE